MEIRNARITSATVNFDDLERLSVGVGFSMENRYGNLTTAQWVANLENLANVQRLEKLMNYAGAYDLEHLKGKIVRVVMVDRSYHGFGDPIRDKYITVWTGEFKEISEAEFKGFLEEILKESN